VIKVAQPETTLFVIERDPGRASNETILRFLREKAKLDPRVED